MATDQGFVEHLQSQAGLGRDLSFKEMFGEYALYFQGNVVAFACDNQLYLKPTEQGRAIIGKVSEHPPYPGAKLYFLIDEQLEDRELLGKLFRATADACHCRSQRVERKQTVSALVPRRRASKGRSRMQSKPGNALQDEAAPRSNPSVERTCCGRLGLPTAGAHVERQAPHDRL